MPTAGSVLITKSDCPTPRIDVLGAAPKPLIAPLVFRDTLGATSAKSTMSNAPRFSSSTPDIAVIARGASCNPSSIRLDETIISSMA